MSNNGFGEFIGFLFTLLPMEVQWYLIVVLILGVGCYIFAQNYPALTEYANSRIIYAANRCLTKMADSKTYNSECIRKLKPLYNQYGRDFLKGPSGRSAKNFSKIARINPRLAMCIYRLLNR